MEKFLSIPVTSEQNQLLSATGIVLIEQLTTTTVGVYYKSGSTGTDVVTITHATAPADNETMRDAIQDAVVAALTTSWTNVSYTVANLPYAVSAITVA